MYVELLLNDSTKIKRKLIEKWYLSLFTKRSVNVNYDKLISVSNNVEAFKIKLDKEFHEDLLKEYNITP
jgi:hypothetical protein